MKALSLWQPWATLMAIGAKRIETRSWTSKYTGPIAIHATAKVPPEGRSALAREPFKSVLAAAGFESAADLPTGGIVAIGKLSRCTLISREAADRLEESDPQEFAFGYYKPGRVAWVFEGVRQLPVVIGCAGAQQLWTPNEETMNRLEPFTKMRQAGTAGRIDLELPDR
jgi:hypothetical protein